MAEEANETKAEEAAEEKHQKKNKTKCYQRLDLCRPPPRLLNQISAIFSFICKKVAHEKISREFGLAFC